jgi:hypothetical protein
MPDKYPYPCQRKTGHFKIYEIRDSNSHKLLYIGVTSLTLNKRCNGNKQYNPKTMYCKEVAQFECRREAEEYEAILITRYRPVMNQALGPGQTGITQTPEHIRKKVLSQAWYKHEDVTKRKIGEANGCRVKCVETGQEFYSMAEAARWCGGQDTKISLVTRGKRKTHKGYKWELV